MQNKLFLIILLFISIISLGTSNVFAEKYTTETGVTLSSIEYNKLVSMGFSDKEIDKLSKEQLNKYKKYDITNTISNIVYTETIVNYDKYGNAIEIIENEVSAEYAINKAKEINENRERVNNNPINFEINPTNNTYTGDSSDIFGRIANLKLPTFKESVLDDDYFGDPCADGSCDYGDEIVYIPDGAGTSSSIKQMTILITFNKTDGEAIVDIDLEWLVIPYDRDIDVIGTYVVNPSWIYVQTTRSFYDENNDYHYQQQIVNFGATQDVEMSLWNSYEGYDHSDQTEYHYYYDYHDYGKYTLDTNRGFAVYPNLKNDVYAGHTYVPNPDYYNNFYCMDEYYSQFGLCPYDETIYVSQYYKATEINIGLWVEIRFNGDVDEMIGTGVTSFYDHLYTYIGVDLENITITPSSPFISGVGINIDNEVDDSTHKTTNIDVTSN